MLRSFTSTFSTVVNMDILELLHKIRRVQLKCELMFDLDGEVSFPREEKEMLKYLSTKNAQC